MAGENSNSGDSNSAGLESSSSSGSTRNLDSVINDSGEESLDAGSPDTGDIEGIVPPSEADLMGFDPEASDDKDGDDGDADKSGDEGTDDGGDGDDTPADGKTGSSDSIGDDDKADDAGNDDEGAQDDGEGDDKGGDDDGKPPRGFVPLEAVREARGENRHLKGENQTLQSENQELKTQLAALNDKVDKLGNDGKPDSGDVPPDFKVLSEQEFQDLTEEAPGEAIVYLNNLHAFRDAEAASAKKAAEEKAASDALTERNNAAQASIDEAYDRMEEVLPGLFGEDNTVGNEIADFAESMGFTEDLHVLTDPGTVILTPGSDEPVVMGNMAAEMLSMFVNIKGKMAERGSKKDTVRAEIEKEVTAKVTKELLAKFKEKGESAFKSVSSLQGTDVDQAQDFKGQNLTEAELSKLTPEEYERYLAGS